MVELKDQIGRTFYRTRHGQHPKVELLHVGRSRVKFKDLETEEVRKTPIEKFKKFYQVEGGN